MAEEVVILMNDCPGIKLPGKISSTVGKYIPGLSSPSPHNVLRGELLVPIKSKHASQDNGRPHVNYIVKKDPNIILYCKAEDVSPLVENLKDSWLLEGIESLSVRHALFIGGKKLEWGSHLVINDTVYSSIPGPNPLVRQCVTAIIRYIGQVKGLPGCQFGIEIMVRFEYVQKYTFHFQCLHIWVSIVDRMMLFVEMVQMMGPLTVSVTFTAKMGVV